MNRPARARLADAVVRRGCPGDRTGIRLPEPGGAECAWLCDGDAWSVYYRDADSRRVVTRHAMSTANAVRLAKFILRWWVVSLWFGIRLRLWNWALLVRQENPETADDDDAETGT